MKPGRFILAFWLLWTGSCLAAPSLTGTWQGKVFFTRLTVQVVQWNTQVTGVVQVHRFFGAPYFYHFNGTAESNRLSGTHHTGHRFEGTQTAEDRVSGVLTTRRGRAIRLTLRRQPDAKGL
ncbi:MAG: hypothetical protein KKC51_14245 [Verrucomicrobia bacterium]|nr:hypothetical protein [Verrucomicrobiota bacterium]